jgi:hypothetical protein
MTFDMVAQFERMVAHQALRPLGVARFEGRNNFLVVDDLALHPLILEDGPLPDGAYMKEQANGDLGNQSALA